jgi:hypothetical protein
MLVSSQIRTIMKITSIDRTLSDKGKVAFRTEPLIQPQVFDQIRRLLQQSAALRGVGLELKEGCLVVVHSSFTPELAKNVNELLTAAETAVQKVIDDARKRAEQEQAEILNAIQTASTAFGVPVQ